MKIILNTLSRALHCNPAGDWNIGGFTADAGVTGRKLAVDNYGPRVPLGGGAFSGKDSTKVDRSAAYMGRRIAVDILEERPEVQEVMVQLAFMQLDMTNLYKQLQSLMENTNLSKDMIYHLKEL